MINRVFRLVDVKRIEMMYREVDFSKREVLVRPEFMSICAADQRYYLGERKKEIWKKKLPLALIHEAVGTVLFDPDNRFNTGEKVVIIPNISPSTDGLVKGNYHTESRFLSSSMDGCMQDIVSIRHDRLISLPEDYSEIYVFSELVSVAYNAIESFERCCKISKSKIGVWGDGSVGFVLALVLKSVYPNSKIYVIGKTLRKLSRFSFAEDTFITDELPSNLKFDHCFECVGGKASESAISQMIDIVNPEGCISILGVSEDPIIINTRSVLDKGISIIGISRSERNDFEKAVDLLHTNSLVKRYLRTIISQILAVTDESCIAEAFEQDYMNDFKTIIKWKI